MLDALLETVHHTFTMKEDGGYLNEVLEETLELSLNMVAYRELFASLVTFLSERDR